MLFPCPCRWATSLRRELRSHSPEDGVVELWLCFVLLVLVPVRASSITPHSICKLSGGSSAGGLSIFGLGADAPGLLEATWSSGGASVVGWSGVRRSAHGGCSSSLALELLLPVLRGPLDPIYYLHGLRQVCLFGSLDALLFRSPVPADIFRLKARGGSPKEEEAEASSVAALALIVVPAPPPLVATRCFRAAARRQEVRCLASLAAETGGLPEEPPQWALPRRFSCFWMRAREHTPKARLLSSPGGQHVSGTVSCMQNMGSLLDARHMRCLASRISNCMSSKSTIRGITQELSTWIWSTIIQIYVLFKVPCTEVAELLQAAFGLTSDQRRRCCSDLTSGEVKL